MNPLQVFPRHPSAPDTYYINGAWAPAAITAVDKRFTDAELAAEFWAATTDATRLIGNARKGGKSSAANVAMTLHRFATLPHYDENPA